MTLIRISEGCDGDGGFGWQMKENVRGILLSDFKPLYKKSHIQQMKMEMRVNSEKNLVNSDEKFIFVFFGQLYWGIIYI